jgi:hypothetical protein
VTPEELLAALKLPAASRVDQRVPKKLLLENGAPTAADKRLINEGVEAIQWLAVLKPPNCGVPEFRDALREYGEIALLRVALREQVKKARLIELLHRAVPYPVLLLVDRQQSLSVSLAHKRYALKEADKIVLDGEPVTVVIQPASSGILAAFLDALDLARQPQVTLYALYQGWMDTVIALQAAEVTGDFCLLASADKAAARRQALQVGLVLQSQIASLRSSAAKASQLARQVELNIEIKRLQTALAAAQKQL